MRGMRSRLALLVLASFAPSLASCGDDPAAPATPPAPGTVPPGMPPPNVDPGIMLDPSGWSWAHTKVGDWVTWEIRTHGSEDVTRLTWRATKVDGKRVEYAVSSKTIRPDGTVTASQESTAVHEPGSTPIEGKPHDDWTRVEMVGGRPVEAFVKATGESHTARTHSIGWTVPLGGLVRADGIGFEQRLVDFGSAPATGGK